MICKERPSTFVRVGTMITGAIGAVTAFGINIASIAENKLGELTTTQIFYGLLGLGFVALAIFLYDRSASRANALNRQKLGIAANPDLTTTELNANAGLPAPHRWMAAALPELRQSPPSITNCEK